MDESRFKRVARDPRFKKIPRKHRKVKIDARFQRMFTDKSFTTKYFVDKRGAVVGKTTKEDLHQFYDLSDDEQADEVKTTGLPIEDNSEKAPKKKTKKGVLVKEKEIIRRKTAKSVDKNSRLNSHDPKDEDNNESSDDDSEDDADNRNDSNTGNEHVASSELNDVNSDDNDTSENKEDETDYARGEGNIVSSDDDNDENLKEKINAIRSRLQDSESDDNEDDEETLDMKKDEPDHQWGELDSEAKMREDATRRLAICNLDWDRLTAKDLLVLFNSVGAKGIIQSVKIYPSEFGLERMNREECYGPEELRNLENDDGDQNGNHEEGSKFSKEKLRQYQLNKLKYYYAVVECDKPETANYLYEECDGVEFEMTGNLLDLRFIPDEMVFDQEPASDASEMPDLATYKPPEFETTALHHSNVKLTWDETDDKRIKTTMRKFSKNDLQDMDFQAYLASSSDEEGDVGEREENRSEVEESENEEERIAKYKKLLQDIDVKEHQDDEDKEMEITWEPGLKESAEDLVTRKVEEKKAKEMTPWEKYLNKKKEKRKEKRKQKNKLTEDENDEESDDIPADVDMSDPFFSQDFGPEFPSDKKDSQGEQKSKKKKRKARKEEGITEEDKKNKEELELLLMDDTDERQHFSLKGIMESEKANKKKKRRLRGKQHEQTADDTFQVDVHDPRFTAMYSSHHYAIDPSDPQFKKTKAVESILKERHRRREDRPVGAAASSKAATPGVTKGGNKKVQDTSLSLLVKSVKSKTEEFQHQKKKRKIN